MNKPHAFQQPYVAAQNIPYLCAASFSQASSCSGGVLSRGQVVWLSNSNNLSVRSHDAPAFVDGIGLVSLDPRWLVSSQMKA